MYTQSILDDIKNRISIVTIVGERVELKRAGRNFKGACPFHSETKPSFMVSEEKQIYHCFGCGEGGNIFNFVMKFEGISFLEAVQKLAERAHVTLPKLSKAQAGEEEETIRKKKMFLKANKLALEYFVANLKDDKKGTKARNYLISRGFEPSFFTQHLLGVAEDRWDGVVNYLSQKNVPQDLALELGLIKKSDKANGGIYDFFRDRLMFPIINPSGDVIGFSGRALSKEEEERAKFLNSADSLIYHKSSSIYGLDYAQEWIRKTDEVILVEGNMDRLRLVQVGIGNVVAPLGTSLTSGHLRLLKRYTKNFVLLFDGDDAGRKAAVRSLALFLEEGLTPKVVVLPSNHDPDSFVRESGVEALNKMMVRASSLFEYVIEVIASEEGTGMQAKINALNRLKPYLQQLDDRVVFGLYSRKIAEKLDIDEATLRKTIESRAGVAKGNEKIQLDVNKSVTEKTIVHLMLTEPRLIPRFIEASLLEEIRDDYYKMLIGLLIDEYAQSGTVQMSRLIDRVQDASLKQDLLSLSLDDKKFEENIVEQIFTDCVAKLKSKSLEETIKKINGDISKAEKEGNDKLVFELITKKKDLLDSTKVLQNKSL